MDSLPSKPSLLLKRAEPLDSSAFKDIEEINEDEPIITESPVSLRRTISASIKKTLGIGAQKDARLSRSRTVAAGTPLRKPGSNPHDKKGRHFRSYSVSGGISPLLNEHALGEARGDAIDVPVPALLLQGTLMTRVSSGGQTNEVLRVDPDLGQIIWETKKHRIIPLESIKELRSGPDARYDREQFQLTQECESRWLTIIYVFDGMYKNLHLIAADEDLFNMWCDTLRRLHTVRKRLMSGLGDLHIREAIWEKHYWRAAEKGDDKLALDDVRKLCRRLTINLGAEELHSLFKQADVQKRNYLDFEDFRRFVKLLKTRPEVARLYKKLSTMNNGIFNFNVFEKFMREAQQSALSPKELGAIFERYSQPSTNHSIQTMTLETFTTFLLSPDNPVFADQHNKVTHDMTSPLSDYYISSSHNTYLVGNQLVGVSTIEGYIRALLKSCRSVELDIYAEPPSEPEPMITHGGTLTSKVPLRDVCTAIAKYGFFTSPYPIIISAEMHCNYAGQEAVVKILHEVFGDILVRRDEGDHVPIDELPSPEELKGKILFKTKNLDFSRRESLSIEIEPVTSAGSASESEMVAVDARQVKTQRRRSSAGRLLEMEGIKEFKEDLLKAGAGVMRRVRSVGRSHSRSPHQLSRQLSGTPNHSNPNSPRPDLLPLPISYTPSPIPGTPLSLPTPLSPPTPSTRASPLPDIAKTKTRMSPALLAILIYTVGVKFRGINKKEVYAPEHMFSLSETKANSLVRSPSEPGGNAKNKSSGDNTNNIRFEEGRGNGTRRGMYDLIKHCRTHLVRIYPKGMRVNSTNYQPHKYWCAGAQLVALNWQTYDLGYMLNHAMFQRNGLAGYVLKPLALRSSTPNAKELLSQRTQHYFDVTIISAQQLPRPKDSSGREVLDKTMIDPLVEVFIHLPDWPVVTTESSSPRSNSSGQTSTSPGLSSRTVSFRTSAVKNNGFNPVWEERLRIPFDCVGDMMDLVFVRFVVRQEDKDEDDEPLGVYCASLGSMARGYRHLPLHDTQLSQYMFSTLFVQINVIDA